MTGALDTLTVVALCDEVPGATCARQFAAWGASVTHLESPGGSPLRGRAPLVEAGGAPVSLMWEYLAAGTRSLLEPSSAEARELLERADVLISDWPAARLAAARLPLASLSQRTVVVLLSPFGTDGPYADYQATGLVLQALSGFMVLNGVPGREPLKAAAAMAEQAIGVAAFVGALAALHERERSGRGQLVEVSCFEALTSMVPLLRSEYSGVDAVRQGGPVSGTFMFECRDGFISLNPLGGRNWQDILLALGVDAQTLPPELRGASVSVADCTRFIREHAPAHGAHNLFTRLNELLIACGVANGPLELAGDGQLAARGFYFDLQSPRLGRVRFPGPPARLSATPMQAPSPSPGVPGEGAAPVPAVTAPSTPRGAPNTAGVGALPLAGVRVLDLTAAWLGPYATMLLADLGADVIKIESHRRPDTWRGTNLPRRAPAASGSPAHWLSNPTNADAHPWNVNSNANSVNRNKRGLALDLTTAEGKALFLRLAESADVVMENFTPRVMANFGLPFDVLRQTNPRLVMVSFSGYGQFGPYRDYRANGATTDTTCGWAALTGYHDGPPTMMGSMEADPITGLQMAATALVALWHARHTGEGQHVEGSMLEACAGYIGEEILAAQRSGANPPRNGNRDRQMAPHGIFPCAGEDEWVAIAVRDDAGWEALAAAAGLDSGLDPERFRTAAARHGHADELEAVIAAWTRTRTAAAVMETLQQAGVPAGVVQNYTAVLNDPQLAARGWFQTVTHPDIGAHRYNGFPWRFSRTPAAVRSAPPRVGEHSAAVLAGELGLSSDEIARLFDAGVCAYIHSRSQDPVAAG